MSYTELFRDFYKKCSEMNARDSVEVALNAETEIEQEFAELVSNFILQQKQKEVIAQRRF